MKATRTPIAVAFAAVALLGGCGGDGGADDRPPVAEARPAAAPDTSSAVSVTVKTFMFAPDPIEIEPGQTV